LITFKSTECLLKIDPTDEFYPVVKDLIDNLLRELRYENRIWNADQIGYFVLVQPDDIGIELVEIHPGRTLSDLPFEGVEKDSYYKAVTLLNNETFIVWIIPDTDWLPDDLKAVLEDNLVPQPGTPTDKPNWRT
jgi:hypothetical protein